MSTDDERFIGIALSPIQQANLIALAKASPDAQIFVHLATIPEKTVLLVYDKPGGKVVMTATQDHNDWQFAVAPENAALLERFNFELALLRLEFEF